LKKTLAIVLGLWLSCGAGAAAQVTAIKAGRLVDPQSATVLNDQIILIRDKKIEEVGKGLAIPADAKVIDLSQMTVLPGLIDCHTHLADGPTDDGDPFSQLKKTAAQVAFESVPNARTFLREGFTTVRDV
jgi:imidazolonepropionase-like amidohydrolase